MFVFVDVINREFGTLLINTYPFPLYLVFFCDRMHAATDCNLRRMGVVVDKLFTMGKLFRGTNLKIG